jgi:hypothetical protein
VRSKIYKGFEFCEVNKHVFFSFSGVNQQYYSQTVRSKIHTGFKFCEVNKRMVFIMLTNLVIAIREDNPIQWMA